MSEIIPSDLIALLRSHPAMDNVSKLLSLIGDNLILGYEAAYEPLERDRIAQIWYLRSLFSRESYPDFLIGIEQTVKNLRHATDELVMLYHVRTPKNDYLVWTDAATTRLFGIIEGERS